MEDETEKSDDDEEFVASRRALDEERLQGTLPTFSFSDAAYLFSFVCGTGFHFLKHL